MKSAAKKQVLGEGQRKEERAEQNRGGWARVSAHEPPIVKDDPRRFILRSNDISPILSLGLLNKTAESSTYLRTLWPMCLK